MLSALRSRVILILIAAALPATVAVYGLAFRNFEMSREAGLQDLRQDVELLMSRIDAAPLAAARLATTLAAGASWDPQFDALCGQRLGGVLPQYRGFDGIAIFRGGSLVCAQGRGSTLDNQWLEPEQRRLTWAQQNYQTGLAVDPAGRPRLFGAARSMTEAGAVMVAMTFVDPQALGDLLSGFRRGGSVHAVIVTATGAMLTGENKPDFASQWPTGVRPTDAAVAVRQVLLDDDRFLSAAVKFTGLEAWLIASQSEKIRLGDAWRQFTGTLAGPALMIIATCLGIWLGLNRLVLRWERRLRTATRAYIRGDHRARVGDVSGAPREFAELAADFDMLADRVTQRTEELEKEITQKNVYIRELHHRVKNNLQVVASLLALQRRGLPPEHQAIIRFPESRVNAIAAAFQLGYRKDDVGAVEVKELILEVCQRFRSDSGDPDALRVEINGADVVISLDDAISLAMIIAEMLADRLAARPVDAPPIQVRIDVASNSLRIAQNDPLIDGRRSTLSSRLLVTYAAQLRAVIQQEAPGQISLTVPLTPIRYIA